MSGVRIEVARRATSELARAVSALNRQLSSSPREWSVDGLGELLSAESNTLFVAYLDDAIVGMLTLVTYPIPTGIRARIEDVVVDESARGRGIAFDLTTAAVDLAREKGARTVDLTSRPERAAANRLYRRAGFTARDSVTYRRTLE
ncbi:MULTISPECIES: GNAT family N-acetyltransferase [unclassified Nocardia]|uniref:GNAT family N-acetyltransferase n=1 Tax=unclassified Nocardia TaxID=2637762 RepID=UPI001CE47DFD|nr:MULTISPECIES: GNAT family N-acetyltransferase [unclassified Nocardia]